MKTDVNLVAYKDLDPTANELKRQIEEMERSIDEYCVNFVSSQEDLQLVSLFQSLLTDLYSELEQLQSIKSILYN